MRYVYQRIVQAPKEDQFYVYEERRPSGAPIARCDKEEDATRIVGALNGTGHKRAEQNEVDYIGCRIASRLTNYLNDRAPVPYRDLEEWVYTECDRIGREQRLGDWIELPNGTTYTLTFKPTKGAL